MVYQVLRFGVIPTVAGTFETRAGAEAFAPGDTDYNVVETKVNFCPAALRPYPQVPEPTYGGLTSAQLSEKQLPQVLADAWASWLSAKAAQGELDEAGQGPPEDLRQILDGKTLRQLARP